MGFLICERVLFGELSGGVHYIAGTTKSLSVVVNPVLWTLNVKALTRILHGETCSATAGTAGIRIIKCEAT